MDRQGYRLVAATCLVWLGLTACARAEHIRVALGEYESSEGTSKPVGPVDPGGEGPSSPGPDVTLYPWPEKPADGGGAGEPGNPGGEPIYTIQDREDGTSNPELYYTMTDCPHPSWPDNPPDTTTPQETITTTTAQVPEPSSLVLAGLGSLGLVWLRRRGRG